MKINSCRFFLLVILLFSLTRSFCQIPDLLDIPDAPYPKEYGYYITMNNKQFWNGNAPFKPLCVNYMVDYVKFKQSGRCVVSPHLNYSERYCDHRGTII